MNQLVGKGTNKYLLIVLLFVGWFIDFLDRMVMGVAVTQIGPEFNLGASQIGLLLSSFFAGYALMQIPGGWLTDKFGSKKIMIISIVVWSLFTLFTGFAWSLASLIVIRFIFGLGEGAFPAAATKSVGEHFPKKERGRAQSIIFSANPIGAAVAPLFAAPLIIWLGWRNVFHIIAILGLILAVAYWIFIKPTSQEKVTELKLNKSKLSFKEIFKNDTVWKLAIMNFGVSAVVYGFNSWLPSYLLKERGVDLLHMGIYASLPSFGAAISLLVSGWLLDKVLLGREKHVAVVTGILSVFFMYMIFNTSSLVLTIVFQVLAFFFLYFNIALIWVLPLKILSTKIVGSAVGTMNTGGQLAGIVSPLAMGFLIDAFNGSFNGAFWFLIIALVICVIATISLKNIKNPEYIDGLSKSKESELAQ